MKKDSN